MPAQTFIIGLYQLRALGLGIVRNVSIIVLMRHVSFGTSTKAILFTLFITVRFFQSLNRANLAEVCLNKMA